MCSYRLCRAGGCASAMPTRACGSIMSGQRLPRVTRTPLSIETSSDGRPHSRHSRTCRQQEALATMLRCVQQEETGDGTATWPQDMAEREMEHARCMMPTCCTMATYSPPRKACSTGHASTIWSVTRCLQLLPQPRQAAAGPSSCSGSRSSSNTSSSTTATITAMGRRP